MTLQSRIGKIHVLAPEVVSRIAAGEVVERPAAVVKELIDNSLDAGSRRIFVEVTEGGRTLIRVSDDGEGMDRGDARLAFQRHATSKLQSDSDLVGIRTLGFRGEALPSIAAVSKVRMLTAQRHDPAGTELVLTGGTVTRIEDAAVAPGTQIEVMDLFFNTPARKKYLKAIATEFAHISQVVQQAALCWPGVAFTLRHNGQAVCEYPAVASKRDRLFQIYGNALVTILLDVAGERPGYRLQGFTIMPDRTRSSRTPQELFVNGRPVKSAAVAHAVYDGYAPSLAKGRHPAFVLFLDVDPHRVDVNVHPTKREVRFADQEVIHQLVRQGIRDALGGNGRVGSPSAPTERSVPPSCGVSIAASLTVNASERSHDQSADVVAALPFSAHEPTASYCLSADAHQFPPDIIALGQISRTFLVAQVGAELHVVDQHTAHERVLFERLWRSWMHERVAIQPLLLPEPFELPPDRATLLTEHLDHLGKLGLEVEPFGSDAFVIRGVPAQLGLLDSAGLIDDILDDLTQWGTSRSSSMEQRLRPLAASLACHGAVRAGRAMKLDEIKQLLCDWVEEGLPMTCPHGRRVALRLPPEELAKIFGRV